MHRNHRIRGNGLVTALIASVIGGIVMLSTLRILGDGMKGAKHVELKGDLEAIRYALSLGIDCEDTFAAAGIDPLAPGTNCTSTSAPGGQTPPFFRLKRKSLNGVSQFFGGPPDPDGSVRMGDWNVRASCSDAEQTLVVRVARPKGNGTFQEDPVLRQLATWDAGRALLFGSGQVLGLCYAAAPRQDFASNLSLTVTSPVVSTSFAYHSTNPATDWYPLVQSPVIPTVTVASSRRATVRAIGNINWDGCSESEFMDFQPVLEYSKDNGATFTQIIRPGTGVHNDGGEFVLFHTFSIAAGDKLQVQVKVRFTQSPVFLYDRTYPTPGTPIPNTCVSDFTVRGGLELQMM